MVLEARKVAGFVGVCQCSESENKLIISLRASSYDHSIQHTL
jgi:hypothetical protein